MRKLNEKNKQDKVRMTWTTSRVVMHFCGVSNDGNSVIDRVREDKNESIVPSSSMLLVSVTELRTGTYLVLSCPHTTPPSPPPHCLTLMSGAACGCVSESLISEIAKKEMDKDSLSHLAALTQLSFHPSFSESLDFLD